MTRTSTPPLTTEANAESPQAVGAVPAPIPAGAWGEFFTRHPATQVLEAARTLSRRGKLPGFSAGDSPCVLFTFDAFGAPFDYTVSAVSKGNAGTAGSHMLFHAKVKPKVPLMFALVTLVSIWPGAPITDSLVRSYFSSYDYPQWVTWAWYLPLTVLPLPFVVWRMWKRSRESAHEHCVESVGVIRAALEHPRG